MKSSSAADRERFLKRIFPEGVPTLWCPPLTHYDRQGAIDQERIAVHLRHLWPYVRGFLIPGSTGDGWELNSSERRQVLVIALEQARALGAQVLVGALHPSTSESLVLIHEDVTWLRSRFVQSESFKVLAEARVCGFTVCPPRGAHLSQESIELGLASVLELGLPTAIYQLPQVTLNEMSPQVAMDLALQYPNFVFFKDTSGADAVALSGKDLAGVFTARGAEGDYARWPKAASGPYDGFLLASANCFARELHQVLADAAAGQMEEARRLSERLTNTVLEALRLAASLPDGNPFANANKAFDHFFAYGPKAATATPPRLHAGSSLPVEFIRTIGDILSREQLMPAKGYLE